MNDSMETVTKGDLEALALGTGVMGSGGGGQPRIGLLRLKRLFQDEAYPDEIELIDPGTLDTDETVTSVGQIGAPTIGNEKLPREDEEALALNILKDASGDSIDALIPGEIGGANSFAPLVTALQTGHSVVDADAMGRALPEIQMDTFFINGKDVDIAVLVDKKSNSVVFRDIDSPKRLEQLARSVTIELGGTVSYAYPLLDGDFVNEFAVPNTLSRCHEIGQALLEARLHNEDPTQRVCTVTAGENVFSGKVSDVERRHNEGFNFGNVEITQRNGMKTCLLDFQNEFLRATIEDHTIATVPDLISVLDTETGKPILADEIQFGQRVDVVCIPAPKLLTTEAALDVVGPEVFGFGEDYVSFRNRLQSTSWRTNENGSGGV